MRIRSMPAISASGADPKLVARVAESDLLLVVGARLDEMTTGGYERIAVPLAAAGSGACLSDPDELNRVTRADLALCSDVAAFAAALAEFSPDAPPVWTGEAQARAPPMKAFIVAGRLPGAVNPFGDLRLAARAAAARRDPSPTGPGTMPDGCTASICTDGWGRSSRRNPGAMGYGFPAAIAAKLNAPGGSSSPMRATAASLMNGQEMATAVQYGAAVVVLVWGQRFLRDDPDASGAALSRPRLGHRSQKSGFRGAGPQLWRGGFTRNGDGGLRAGLRGGARCRRAGADPHRD